MNTQNLHQNQGFIQTGCPLPEAKAVMVMVHGRGATAESILDLARDINVESMAFVAPQAYGNSWYPHSFLAPREMNEPGITDGLSAIHSVVEFVRNAGIPIEKIFLLGFSQGACLALEYAATYTAPYAGVFGLSGGLIGPSISIERFGTSLEGVNVFLGCSDIDPHIPKQRVLETQEVFKKLDANVTTKLYEQMGHYINEDELLNVKQIINSLPG